MIDFIVWWMIAQILGLAALPVAFVTLRWLPDRGYAFAKILGLLLVSYLLWLGAITGFIKNDLGGILFAILAAFGLSTGFLFRNQQWGELKAHLSQNKRYILVFEILFLIAFASWTILRAYAPDKVMNAGGEKFMEMAFLNGVLNSHQFPPIDPWLSGFAISYYYFGYIMMGILTQFSGSLPGVGFELYDALLFAFTVVAVFGIVYNLIARQSIDRKQTFKHRQAIFYGLFGSLLVVIMGNLEGFLESLRTRGLLSENFWRWLDIPGLADSPVSGNWFPGGGFFGCCWRASRIVQDYDLLDRPMGVSPITEFPMFSFLLGDNHPHVLALPFVLLSIALALNLLIRTLQASSARHEAMIENNGSNLAWWNPVSAFGGQWGLLIFYAFCLGALGFLNTWDMPIYLGLVVLAYALGGYIRQRNWRIVFSALALGASLLFGALLFFLLFYLGFSSQAGGILPYVFKPTRLIQYLVMFGTFIFILSWYLIVSLIKKGRQDGKAWVLRTFIQSWAWILVACIFLMGFTVLVVVLAISSDAVQSTVVQYFLNGTTLGQSIQSFILARLSQPWLFLLLTGLLALTITHLYQPATKPPVEAADPAQAKEEHPGSGNLFSFLMILAGIGLTLSVEFFYLRDSFGVRMNTVFKFYYQAWILLGIASTYAIWWLLNDSKPVLSKTLRMVFMVSTALFIIAGLVYPLGATYARVDGFRGSPNLDGTSILALTNPDDWAAIDWLRTNANWKTVILEAPGKSYNYEGRISAFSGIPALLGWAVHEAQWRGNYDEQGRREVDIETIYTTKDGSLALALLQKWGVDYVMVGSSEVSYIQRLCSEPNRACNLNRALNKFDNTLTPVFKQGRITIYQVPLIDK